MYIVKYDYIGEDSIDSCYGIEDNFDSHGEALEHAHNIKESGCICNVEIIGMEDY